MNNSKKTWSNIISLIVSFCLLATNYFAFALNQNDMLSSIQQPSKGNGEFFTPAYSGGEKDGLLKKQAVPVEGKDGYYDITLSLTPPTSDNITTIKKTDIVLVVDKSASMSDDDIKSIKSATKELVDKVLADTLKNHVRVAVVAFSGPTTNNATTSMSNSVVAWDFSNNATTIKSNIDSIKQDGGTNTEAGIKRAYELLQSSGAEQKFVVFLSDGAPSFRLTKISEKVEKDKYVNYGTGSSDNYGYNKTCSLAWADALKAPIGQTCVRTVTGSDNKTVTITDKTITGLGAKIFSVGYGVDTSDYASPNTSDVKYYYPANQAGQISNIFKLIQQNIINSFSASNIILKDIVTNEFDIVTPASEVIVTGQAVPADQYITIENNTVTVPLGSITSSNETKTITITFRIKLKEDSCLEAGSYTLPTNTKAEVTYLIGGENKNQVFEVPTVNIQVDKAKYNMKKTALLKNWEDRTYDITLQAWSQKPTKTELVDKTQYISNGAITPDSTTVGKNYLVYIGNGNNTPISQNPDDYKMKVVGSETIEQVSRTYWTKDTYYGVEEYVGDIYIRNKPFDYSKVGHTSNFVPTNGVTYFSIDSYIPFVITQKKEASYTTNYFWEDNKNAGAVPRMTYKTQTIQVPVTSDASSPINAITKVVDVVDSHFDIVSTSPPGAVIEGNKVTWTLNSLTGTATNPGFVGTITVKAKDNFAGGNNIKTNVESQSGLIIGKNELKPFKNQPSVNVKAKLNLSNTQREIFLGEKIPNDSTILSDMGAVLDGVTYKWTNGDGVVDGKLPSNFIPNTSQNRDYTLTATLVMQAPSGDSTTNSKGYFNGNESNNYTLNSTGIYTVLIKTGKITITKNIVDKNGAPTLPHDSSQTFLFKVLKDGKLFCEVSLIPGKQTSISKTLTNLPAGEYTIIEDTQWSWRYACVGDTQTKVTINKQLLTHSVSFKNQFSNKYWLEGKDNVTNVFTLE